MGLKNSDFDNLDDMFGGNPVNEFEDLMDGIYDEF